MPRTKKTPSDSKNATETPKSWYKLHALGTGLVLHVKLQKMATGNAGTNGIKFQRVCRTHRLPINRLEVCQGCGTSKPITDADVLKRYTKAGPKPLDVEPAQIEARKVRNDGAITIVGYGGPTDVGLLSPQESIWALTPGANALLPASEADIPKWQAFRQLLCDADGTPSRVAQVRFVAGGSSKRTVHGLIYPLHEGGLAFDERYRPEDTKRVDWPDAKPLDQRTVTAYSAKGADLAEKFPMDPTKFNEDAYRESMEQLFMALIDEVPVPDVVDDALPETDVGDDLLAALEEAEA